MGLLDVLESVLKQKIGGSGRNPDALNDILRGGRKAPAPQSAPRETPTDIQRESQDLEDMLGVGQGGNQPAPRAPQAPSRPPGNRPAPPAQPQQRNSPFPEQPRAEREEPFSRGGFAPEASPSDDLVLVCAMLNAAKADGDVSQDEQKKILDQLGDADRRTIDYLRAEFTRPVDVRAFAWDVPLGLEQQVYTVSLLSIDLDSEKEAAYLRDLAHGLRLPPEILDMLHRRAGAPSLR